MSMPVSGNFTMFCIFIRRSPSCRSNTFKFGVFLFFTYIVWKDTILYLSEAFQVKYEDVWQGPQAEFDAALLKLFTVWTAPCIIRSKLKLMWKRFKTKQVANFKHKTGFTLCTPACRGKMYILISISNILCAGHTSLPVPLWCRVESTGRVSRSEAADAAPSLAAHFQHRGCTRPQFFWTDCGRNTAGVTEGIHYFKRVTIQRCAKVTPHVFTCFIYMRKHIGIEHIRKKRVCTIPKSLKVNIWWEHHDSSLFSCNFFK